MSGANKIQDNLLAALEAVLTALVLNGGDQGDDIPTDAIDTALSVDPQVRSARQVFQEALRGLIALGTGDGHHQAVLGVEEATNALVARSADAACRVGLRVGRGLKG